MDGAEWVQSFVEIHRADAVRILDVPHAAEHLATLLEALTTSGMTFPATMLERCVHVRTHRGSGAFAPMADRVNEAETLHESLREHLGSVRKRLCLMPSPTFR
jgi:hypothetical protein